MTIDRGIKRSPARKHHYVPQFYLQRWQGPDGKLCEYGKFGDRVVPHRKPKKGAGYEIDLYTIDHGVDGKAQIIETDFLKKIDDRAAVVIESLYAGRALNDMASMTHLSQFVISLILRDPETVSELKSSVERLYEHSIHQSAKDYDKADEELVAEFRRINPFQAKELQVQTFVRLMSNEVVGTALNSLVWSIVDVSEGGKSLLTSDRPVFITDSGIGQPRSFVALPIGPYKALFGFKDPRNNHLAGVRPEFISVTLNTEIVMQARKYVYGSNDCQLAFVQRNMGGRKSATIQQLVRRRTFTDLI